MGERRAAVYARTSSDQQSIGHQLAALHVQVTEDELQAPAEREFVDDGYGGATLARPALDRLRELIAKRGIERVYVQSADRLARTCAHQKLLLDEFQAAGIEVVCIDNRRLHPAALDGMTLGHA